MTLCCNHQGLEQVVQINVYGATLAGMLTKGVNIPHILGAFGYGDCIVFDVPRRELHPVTSFPALHESRLSDISHRLFSSRRELKIEDSPEGRSRSFQPFLETSANVLLNCSLSTIHSCRSSVIDKDEEPPAHGALEEDVEFVQERVEQDDRFEDTDVPRPTPQATTRFVEMSDSRLFTDDISFSASVADCVFALVDDVCSEVDDATVVHQKSPINGDHGRRFGEEEKQEKEVADGEQEDVEAPLAEDRTMPIAPVSTPQSSSNPVGNVQRSDVVVESAAPSPFDHEEKPSESTDAVVVKASESSEDVAPEEIPPQHEEPVYHDEYYGPESPSAIQILSDCLQDTGDLFPPGEYVDVEAVYDGFEPVDGFEDPAEDFVVEYQVENELQENGVIVDPMNVTSGVSDLYHGLFAARSEESQIGTEEAVRALGDQSAPEEKHAVWEEVVVDPVIREETGGVDMLMRREEDVPEFGNRFTETVAEQSNQPEDLVERKGEKERSPLSCGDYDDFFDCSQGEFGDEDHGDVEDAPVEHHAAAGDFGEYHAYESFLEPDSDTSNSGLPTPRKKARLSRKNSGGNGEVDQGRVLNVANVECDDVGGTEAASQESGGDVARVRPTALKRPRPVLKTIEGKTFACSFANCGRRIMWKTTYGRVRFLDHARTHYSRPTYKCVHCDYLANYEAKMRYHSKTKHPNLPWAKPIDVASDEDKEAINDLWDVCWPGVRKERTFFTTNH